MQCRISCGMLSSSFTMKNNIFTDIDWVYVNVLFQNILCASFVSRKTIEFNTNFRAQLLNLSHFRLRSLYTIKSSSLETLFTMFVLVLGDWELRTYLRAFALLFGVAGKCFLILLLWRQDFRVDLGSLNGTETINLLFSLCFLTLSIDDLYVDGVLSSLISEFLSFRFGFHILFPVVLHLILSSLHYIYLSFSVILFLHFLCFYTIFACVLQM